MPLLLRIFFRKRNTHTDIWNRILGRHVDGHIHFLTAFIWSTDVHKWVLSCHFCWNVYWHCYWSFYSHFLQNHTCREFQHGKSSPVTFSSFIHGAKGNHEIHFSKDSPRPHSWRKQQPFKSDISPKKAMECSFWRVPEASSMARMTTMQFIPWKSLKLHSWRERRPWNPLLESPRPRNSLSIHPNNATPRVNTFSPAAPSRR